MNNAVGDSLASPASGIESARQVLRLLFQDVEGGVRFRLWDGSELKMGSNPGFTLVFNSAAAFREAALSRSCGLTMREWIAQRAEAPPVERPKKKRRKGYRLRRGHRQQYTEVEITNIG